MKRQKAAFRIHAVEAQEGYGGPAVKVVAGPVMVGESLIPQAERYYKATPVGNLEMFVTNPALVGTYKAGEEFIAELVPVDEIGDRDRPVADAALTQNGIGWAVKHLQAGRRVQRRGWNGKGMHLELVRGVAGRHRPYVVICPPDGIMVPWVCSQTDLLGMDWQLAE